MKFLNIDGRKAEFYETLSTHTLRYTREDLLSKHETSRKDMRKIRNRARRAERTGYYDSVNINKVGKLISRLRSSRHFRDGYGFVRSEHEFYSSSEY